MTIEDIIKKKKIDVVNDSRESSKSNEINIESGSSSFDTQGIRNLIINYLPQHMNEAEVHNLFSTIGEVESCKLVRSRESKQSLGYAFVKYKNHEHAQEAVDKLNRVTLGNKVIKVSFARPSKPEIKDANLYVGGLPPETTAEDLKKLFGRFGEIITCRVVQADTSNDYYFGFVRFDTKKEATDAMEALHGKVPCQEIIPNASNPLTVKFAKTPQLDVNLMYPSKNEYDSNVCRNSMRLSPEAMLKAYGRVHSQYLSSMVYARESEERQETLEGESKKYSDTINQFTKRSSGCSCCLQSPNGTSTQGYNVVLTNLPADASELMLYRLCSKYGAISSVQVFFEENNWFAIINMISTDEAQRAVNSLNGLLLQPFTPIKAEIY